MTKYINHAILKLDSANLEMVSRHINDNRQKGEEMKKVATWMPVEENFGDSEIKRIQFLNRKMRLEDGFSVYIHTTANAGDDYQGQVIQISFMDKNVTKLLKGCLHIEFETLMDLNLVMKKGVTINPSLLRSRGPEHVFDVTVAHYLAAHGKIVIEESLDTQEIKVYFICGPYADCYRMTIKEGEGVFSSSGVD